MSDLKVIDSHFHVWNLDTQNLPWLDGTDGTITHTYKVEDLEPELFSRMHKAYQSGDLATAVECAERISKLMAVYDVCDLFVSAIKAAVNVKGLPISTKIFEPAVQATPEQVSAIRELLA